MHGGIRAGIRRSRLKKILFAGIAAAAIGWVAWPYYSLHSLASAIRDGDVVSLEGKVDWTNLRAGLRDDLKGAMAAAMTKKSANASGSDALGMGLAAMLGPAIIDRAVDAYVTPQGLANLISEGKPSGGASSSSGERRSFDWSRIDYAFFSGPTDFRVDVRGNKPDEKVTLAFRFDGGWKLSRVFLPLDKLSNSMN